MIIMNNEKSTCFSIGRMSDNLDKCKNMLKEDVVQCDVFDSFLIYVGTDYLL